MISYTTAIFTGCIFSLMSVSSPGEKLLFGTVAEESMANQRMVLIASLGNDILIMSFLLKFHQPVSVTCPYPITGCQKYNPTCQELKGREGKIFLCSFNNYQMN